MSENYITPLEKKYKVWRHIADKLSLVDSDSCDAVEVDSAHFVSENITIHEFMDIVNMMSRIKAVYIIPETRWVDAYNHEGPACCIIKDEAFDHQYQKIIDQFNAEKSPLSENGVTHYKLEMEGSRKIVLKSNGRVLRTVKNMRDGKQGALFNIVYKHQNKSITLDSLIQQTFEYKFDEADRLDNLIRNVIGNELLKLTCSIASTKEIIFSAEFTSDDMKKQGVSEAELLN